MNSKVSPMRFQQRQKVFPHYLFFIDDWQSLSCFHFYTMQYCIWKILIAFYDILLQIKQHRLLPYGFVVVSLLSILDSWSIPTCFLITSLSGGERWFPPPSPPTPLLHHCISHINQNKLYIKDINFPTAQRPTDIGKPHIKDFKYTKKFIIYDKAY